jgi:ubiquinone/menaquinone biosynthesis C-methylase UbiE
MRLVLRLRDTMNLSRGGVVPARGSALHEEVETYMDSPAWFLDELAHAGGEHLDPAYVAAYDRKARVDPTEDLALLRTLGLNEHSIVVDLGAGSGAFALAVAPLCRRVIAVDVSPAMIATLQTKAQSLGLQNVEGVRGGFLSYAHHGDPADVVYSRHALHHLPDFWKAVALVRVSSIVRSGGVLRLRDLVFSCEPREVEDVIETWLSAAAAHPDAGWTRRELEAHLREEHSTFSWLLEEMLERASFQIRQADYDSLRIYAAYTCVKG